MEHVLRLVTYNVHRFTLGGGVSAMLPGLKMLEPSVLCLNEVDTSRQNTSLDILASTLVILSLDCAETRCPSARK